MIYRIGDVAILGEIEHPELQPYIGKFCTIEEINITKTPTTIKVVISDDLHAVVYLKHLELPPPKDKPFQYDDLIKITKLYNRTPYHICRRTYEKPMLGEVGKIKSYDYRDESYLVKLDSGEKGWFPAPCLIPLEYEGKDFFYPLEKVIYQEKTCIISEVKNTEFKKGQLLRINGKWIPSTEVTKKKGWFSWL